jgi:hypothetical protein
MEIKNVHRLFEFAVGEIPRLVEFVGSTQHPVYRCPDAQQSFDIAKVNQQIKSRIQIKEPKSVIIHVDRHHKMLRLTITQLVHGKLRDMSASVKDVALLIYRWWLLVQCVPPTWKQPRR